MDTANNQPNFRYYLIIALVLGLLGWGGLAIVIWFTLPYLGPRWLFFFLGVLALSGTALPLVYFLNLRFPAKPPVEPSVILREAVWFGVYGSTLAWLRMGRMLNPLVAGVLLVAIILIEVFLRISEQARWRPKE